VITPQDTFKKEKDQAERWQDTVDMDQFHKAAITALAQMQMNMTAPPDMASAASYAWRMEGAKQFLKTLMELAMAPAPVPHRDDGTLDYSQYAQPKR
jgi:hypothetical protein